jgi:DNA primase
MSISQEIESRVNIVELVSRYVPLKKSGANFKALSPFVQEKTPSFMVSPAKNIAYCFSSRK